MVGSFICSAPRLVLHHDADGLRQDMSRFVPGSMPGAGRPDFIAIGRVGASHERVEIVLEHLMNRSVGYLFQDKSIIYNQACVQKRLFTREWVASFGLSVLSRTGIRRIPNGNSSKRRSIFD